MKIILIGPPGVGKGTQSQLLQKRYGFKCLSSGDILRQEVVSNSELGRYAKTFLDSGELLPDEVIVNIIMDHLYKIKTNQNFILFDGFPRTKSQAQKLDIKLEEEKTKIDYVIIFEASSSVILSRLEGRLSCSSCGAVYHIKNHPPIQVNVCNHCQSPLFVRTDDQRAAINKRIKLYDSITYPLIEYYVDFGKVHKINAEFSAQDVFKSVCQILDTAL